MSFNINETIETKLHYKDIANIAVAIGEFTRRHKSTMDKEHLKEMNNLVDRLGAEMYNCPQDDEH